MQRTIVSLALGLTAACGDSGPAVTSTGSAPGAGCTGTCASASSFMTVADVQQVIAQAVGEAQARGAHATIAVVDRVGNVLAVYRMGSAASREALIASRVDAAGNAVIASGLEGIRAQNLDLLAAISKAITGAYLSSEGNAFSSRTASQIVQQHFDPGTSGAPSGPLFGVQFSQLACSDLVNRSTGAAPTFGPQRSPLGLSADPGGFPLYKGGTVVGGVGVLADGLYGVDESFPDPTPDLDETIAMAATYGYGAPPDRRADQITVGGLTLHYTNSEYSDLASSPAAAASFASLGTAGALVAVTGYADGNVHAGTAFGQSASGVRPDTSGNFPGLNAYTLVDGSDQPRFPLRAGTDGANALTEAEVLQLLQSALGVANEARGQIRLPLGSTARVSVSIVDSLGQPLGFVRSQDAPIFGADVALQKARTAALLSSSSAASFFGALPPAQYIATPGGALASAGRVSFADYVSATQTFFADSTMLANGIAFSNRAVGDIARPFFPDGIDGSPNGPLSKPFAQWSVFSTGLQLDLSVNAILQHVLYALGAGTPDVPVGCTGVGLSIAGGVPTLTASSAAPRLVNGLQIFPGSVPIYRGSVLVGAIGVSGDGVDQDDMVALLGLQRAAQKLGTISQAAKSRRADTLTPQGVRLLYVQCPQSPFLDSSSENVCNGY